MSESELKGYLQERVEEVEGWLRRVLAAEGVPSRLREAVEYSLFAGGKRIRPVLALEAAWIACGDHLVAMPVACGIEMIHTYSLIHDDLPAMDDDDLRRGRPTNHKVFGEAVAILAGDALLTLAFEVISRLEIYPRQVEPARVLRAVNMVSRAAGWAGMVGGQVIDLEMEGATPDPRTVDEIHLKKTAKMIQVSLEAGAVVAGASEKLVSLLGEYGLLLGLTFQVVDDILGAVGDEKSLGKPVGKDVERGKMTYPAVWGVERSREKARELTDRACQVLEPLEERGERLKMLSSLLLERVS